jgi:hypothetical protein
MEISLIKIDEAVIRRAEEMKQKKEKYFFEKANLSYARTPATKLIP